MPYNFTPFIAPPSRYCYECREKFPLDEVTEEHPVPGLSVYLCKNCKTEKQS